MAGGKWASPTTAVTAPPLKNDELGEVFNVLGILTKLDQDFTQISYMFSVNRVFTCPH